MFKFSDYTNNQLRELHFFIPMQPIETTPFLGIGLKAGNSEDGIPIECKICERRYKLDACDGFWPYKIELEPVDSSLLAIFGRESYYGCDFEKLVNQDYVHLKQSPTEHVELVDYDEPLCGNTKLHHTGYAIIA